MNYSINKKRMKAPVRLNANENFYGCSPYVPEAVKKNLKNVHLYPSMPERLEAKLANKCGVSQKNIVVGAGSVRLIDGIIQTFVKPDEEIIIFERSFIAYEQLAAAHLRRYIFAKQTNFVCDVKNVPTLITEKTKVIFIANPNNPTGTIISHVQLEHLLKNIPEKVLVITDEAYCEYVTDSSFPDSVSLQKKHSNLIILRTFSKIYGLAGLRVGYGIMREEMANIMKKNRIPFFFSSISEDAALAALADRQFVASCVIRNAEEREFLYEKFKKKGYNVIPSQGNFLYLYFDSEQEKEKQFSRYAENGLLVCNLTFFGQTKALRIGVGDRAINERLVFVSF